MANPEHVKVVNEGSDATTRWRRAHFGKGLDLRGVDLRNADLEGADLRDASLYGANLDESNLRFAHLHRADLNQATLRGADLTEAFMYDVTFNKAKANRCDLSGAVLNRSRIVADLQGAVMVRSHLKRVRFSGSLVGADLSGANLKEAELLGVDLRGTRFDDALFGQTVLRATNLRESVGLATARHQGPTSLSVGTLARSQGGISPRFLRGCGFSDWEIEASKLYRPGITEAERTDILYRIAELQRGRPIQFYSVFISYSHANKDFATKLHDALQERGVRCWLDEKSIRIGDRIRHAVDEGIRLSDKILVCCSDTSLNESTWVEEEIEKALQKERLARKRRRELLALVPLDLDGSVFEWDHALRTTLLSRKAADFRGWESDEAKFNASLEKVIAALRLDESGRESVPEGRL